MEHDELNADLFNPLPLVFYQRCIRCVGVVVLAAYFLNQLG